MMNLKNIIELYKNDESNFTDLLTYLKPTIKIILSKYSFKILEEDLISYLWSLIENLNIHNFNRMQRLLPVCVL